MYHVQNLAGLQIQERWRKNRTYNSMRVLIGEKAGNADCYLDIHEKYHGPHGLIAGTTGSGKSETLQTYILSLAVNFSPDDIAFFLIDFKGGGMANLFSDLPHLAGQISNLSGNQVHRAMISIKSENKRRQRIFGEYGVNNINSYTRLYKNQEASLPIPHLFIIIDEFAELKREEPEFMRELISVAQVGRSLGVHLILATQKPSGTVDDNIWSNSKFRLCLRVQDRQDSNDMLHKPDAAFITQAGRCYLQVGNDEIYQLFQSGYSGAPYEGELGTVKENAAVLMTNTGRAAVVGSKKKKGIPVDVLRGKNIALIFEKNSTRTRCSFEVAAHDLGMGSTYLDPKSSQIGKKESIKDTARVLGRIYDGIEYRGFGQEIVEELGKYAGVPVWNGLTNEYHPTQMLADLLTIQEHLGKTQGVKLVYLGDARYNMGNSLMILCAKMGMNFVACAPKKYFPNQELVEECKKFAQESGGSITLTEDVMEGTKGADVVTTDVWVSMGEPDAVWEERIRDLTPYKVTEEVMKNAGDQAIFLHCLPSFHDLETEIGKEMGKKYNLTEMEVTDQVFESPQSVVFDEAENRMHTIKAVMAATLGAEF